MADAVFREATGEADWRRCYPLLRQLRPHLEEDACVAQIGRQSREAGYRLIFLESGGVPVAAAGYRITEFLAWGKTLYLDDLITDASHRGHGHAGRLLRRLEEIAHSERCDQIHLDSGYQRKEAHRLYLNAGFALVSHHFAKSAADSDSPPSTRAAPAAAADRSAADPLHPAGKRDH